MSTKDQLIQARDLIQQKDFAAARDILVQLPGDPTAEKWLAKIDAAMKKRQSAEDTASESDDFDEEAALEEVMVLMKARDLVAARKLLEKMPDNIAARGWMARIDAMTASANVLADRPFDQPATATDDQSASNDDSQSNGGFFKRLFKRG